MIFFLSRACLYIFLFFKTSSSSQSFDINETRYVDNYFVTHMGISDFIVALEDSEILRTIHKIFKNVIDDLQKNTNQEVNDFKYNKSEENKKLENLATGFLSTKKKCDESDANERAKLNINDLSNKKLIDRTSQYENISKSEILEGLHNKLSCILKTIVNEFYSKLSQKFGLINDLNDKIIFIKFEEIVKKFDFNKIMIDTYFKTSEIAVQVDMVKLIAQILSIDKFVDIFVAFGWIFLGNHIMDFDDNDLILSILRKKFFCEYKANNLIKENTTYIFGENISVLEFCSDILINKINQMPLDDKPIQTNIYYHMDTFLSQRDNILENIHILLENSADKHRKKMIKDINVLFQAKIFKQWTENVEFFAKNLEIMIQSNPNVTIFFSLDDHVFEYNRESQWNVIKKKDYDYLKNIKIPDEYKILKKMILDVKRELESIFRQTLMKPYENLDIMERKGNKSKNIVNLKNNCTLKKLKKIKNEFVDVFKCDSNNILDNVPSFVGQASNKHFVHIYEKKTNYNLSNTSVQILEKQKSGVLEPKTNEIEDWIITMLKMLKHTRNLDLEYKKNSTYTIKTTLSQKKNISNVEHISETDMYPKLSKEYVPDKNNLKFATNQIKNKDISKNKESCIKIRNEGKKDEININLNKSYETNYRKIDIVKKSYEKDTKNINALCKKLFNAQKNFKIMNSRNSHKFIQIKNIRKRNQNYHWREKNLTSVCSQKYRVEKKTCNFYKYNKRLKIKKNNIVNWKIKKYLITDIIFDTNLLRRSNLEKIKEDRFKKLEKQIIKNLSNKMKLQPSMDYDNFNNYKEQNFKDNRFYEFSNTAQIKKISHVNLPKRVNKNLDERIVGNKSKSLKKANSPNLEITKEGIESKNMKKVYKKTNKAKKLFKKLNNFNYENQYPFSENLDDKNEIQTHALNHESNQNEENDNESIKSVSHSDLHGQNKKIFGKGSTDKPSYMYENSNKCIKPLSIKDIYYRDIENLCFELNEFNKISDKIAIESPISSDIEAVHDQDIVNSCYELNEFNKVSDKIAIESPISSDIEALHNQDIENLCFELNEFNKISDKIAIESPISSDIEALHNQDIENLCDELNEFNKIGDKIAIESPISSDIEALHNQDIENLCDELNENNKLDKITYESQKTTIIKSMCVRNGRKFKKADVKNSKNTKELLISSKIKDIQDQSIKKFNAQSKTLDTKNNYHSKKDKESKCIKKYELGDKQNNSSSYTNIILNPDICNDRQAETEKTPLTLSKKRKDHIKKELQHDMLLVMPKETLSKSRERMNKGLYKNNVKHDFDKSIEDSKERNNISDCNLNDKDLEKLLVNKDYSFQKKFQSSKIKSLSLEATKSKDLLKFTHSESKNNKPRVYNLENEENLENVKFSNSESSIKETYHIQKNTNNFENPDLNVNLKYRMRELYDENTNDITLSTLHIQKSRFHCKNVIDNTEDYLNESDKFKNYSRKNNISYKNDQNKSFQYKNQRKDVDNFSFCDKPYIRKTEEKKRPTLEVNLIEFHRKDNKKITKLSRYNFKNYRGKSEIELYNQMRNQNILPAIETNEKKNNQKDDITIEEEKESYNKESYENPIILNDDNKKLVKKTLLLENQKKENETENKYQKDEIKCGNCHTIKHPIYKLFICSKTSFDLIHKITRKRDKIDS